MIEHVAIVGGGFSGTLQAINLLRHEGPRATLIERAERPGTGLAYGAAHPSHLLNVRAANMSALPDDPAHLVGWLEARGAEDAARQFVPRLVYGEYLREMLAAAVAAAPERLRIVRGEATDVVASGEGARVLLDGGETIEADAAVLGVGNLPPHTPAGIDPDALGALYVGDPWASGIAEGLSENDTVLIVGTGLTMVDVALKLEAAGFAGRIVALSRRGLLPRQHADAGTWDKRRERPQLSASALLGEVRARAEAIGWREAVDELRPFTQDMWRVASRDERARFLRHLRPWWDVHRHRLAPEVADRLAAMEASGRLVVEAGKLVRVAPDGTVTWRRRSEAGEQALRVARVVNCTGPLGDLERSTEPLLRRLAARGTIRPDAQHIGIDVDPQARTLAADGTANDWLYALGPMTRGAFWEIVAVPDIRTQTWNVARRLSNAQWVGGEGL